eukprot:6593973-Pyramimonas_sp.AAC.1
MGSQTIPPSLEALAKEVLSIEERLAAFEESFERNAVCKSLDVIKRRLARLEKAMKTTTMPPGPGQSLYGYPRHDGSLALEQLAQVVAEWTECSL